MPFTAALCRPPRVSGAKLRSSSLSVCFPRPFEGSYPPSIVLGNKLAASLVQVLWAEKTLPLNPAFKWWNVNRWKCGGFSLGAGHVYPPAAACCGLWTCFIWWDEGSDNVILGPALRSIWRRGNTRKLQFSGKRRTDPLLWRIFLLVAFLKADILSEGGVGIEPGSLWVEIRWV